MPGVVTHTPGMARRYHRSPCDPVTGRDGVLRAEPGLFELWVCASSAAGEPVQFELLKG